MKEMVKIEDDIIPTIVSLEECIIKYNSGITMRNEAIHEASLLGEEILAIFQEKVGVSDRIISRAISHEEAKKKLSFPPMENLNNSENCLSLSFSNFERLWGITTDEREYNFQEIYKATGRIPNGTEIGIYNALKAHAENGKQLDMVEPIYKAILPMSNALKQKFMSASAPYKIPKLFQAIESNADESILIGIADTGKVIANKTSEHDKRHIRELEEEVALLHRRLDFFKSQIQKDKINNFLKIIDYTVKSLKKIGGDKDLMNALKILGVEATVNIEELKKAYKRQVSIHHSDIGGDEEILRSIIEANVILKRHIERKTNG